MEIEIVSNRRRTSALNGARRAAQRRPSDDSQLDRAFSAAPALPLHQAPTPNPPLAETSMFRSLSANMQPFSCDLPCAADSMAANGHHFRPNPHQPAATRPNPQPLQRWEGNNLVACVIPALQHVQQVPPSAFAAAAAGAPADAEPMAGQGFAAGKKRSSGDMDDSAVQPGAKRWQIEAYGGGFGTTLGSNASNDGNATRCDGNAGAVVDCFDCGKVKVEGVAQPLRTKITLKVKMPVNPAAAEQQHPAVGLV